MYLLKGRMTKLSRDSTFQLCILCLESRDLSGVYRDYRLEIGELNVELQDLELEVLLSDGSLLGVLRGCLVGILIIVARHTLKGEAGLDPYNDEPRTGESSRRAT